MVYTVDLLGDANLRVRDLTITRNTYLANVVVDASADLNSVTTVGNTTTNSIEITSAQASTSKLTGALKVSGGVGVQGNVHVGSNLFVESNLEVGTANLFVDTTTGNVGIGTTNPQGLLHISSGTSGDAHLILEADTDNNNESDNPKIVFKQDGGYYIGEIGLTNNQMAFRNKTGSGGGFIFYSNVSAVSTTDINELEDTQVEVMRISADGNVGIGSNNPKTPLEVRQPDGYFKSMYIQKYLGSGPEQATSYVLLLKSESSNPKRFSGKISGVRGYSSVNSTFEAEIIASVSSTAVLSGRMTFTYSGNTNQFYAKLVSLTYNSSTYIALALIPTVNYRGMSGGIYFNGKTSDIDELQYITDLNTLSSIVDFPVSDGDKTTFTGNVGIGTTDAQAKLDVHGDVQLNDILTINSSVGNVKKKTFTSYNNNSGVRYWKVASGNYNGTPRNTLKMNVSIQRVDDLTLTRRLVMRADNNTLSFSPGIDEHDVYNSYPQDLRVYKNTDTTTFDIYLLINSYTYVDVEILFSGAGINVYDTPTWETSAPSTSGTYTLEFTNGNLNAMKIANNGNIGIGTTNPGGYKLNVNGFILGTTIRGTQLNINGVGYMVSGNGNIAPNTGVDTGISLYAGTGGGSIYLMISGQNNSGSQTGTWAYIVRRYYSTYNTWTNSSSTVTTLAAMNGMTSPNPGNPTLYRNSSTGRLDFKFPNAATNYKFTAYVI